MGTVQILEKEGSQVLIVNDVVAKLVEQIIKEIDGAEIFNIENNAIKELVAKSPFAKPMKIEFLPDSVVVSVNVSVVFGKKLQEVAVEVQEKITQEIEAFTGIKVSAVNVTVVNII